MTELGHLRTALRRASFQYAYERRFDIDVTGAMMEAIDTVIDEATADSVAQFQEDNLAQMRQCWNRR